MDDGHQHRAERLHRFAHDIRNRLTGMHQALQHLAGDGAPAEKDELLSFGEQQLFKALREVEDLLDDMGVDRGVGKLRMETLLPAQLVRDAVRDLEHRFTRKEQKTALELDEDLPVTGDPHHVPAIIAALLSNASKFSPQGSAIRVRLVRGDGQAVLHVRDEGVGLTADDLAQVFVRYAWLQSRSTDGEAQGRGTLARVRQWAEAHGGTLEAHSEGPGRGCTFTLRLPLA